jgi:hypothetical protein
MYPHKLATAHIVAHNIGFNPLFSALLNPRIGNNMKFNNAMVQKIHTINTSSI